MNAMKDPGPPSGPDTTGTGSSSWYRWTPDPIQLPDEPYATVGLRAAVAAHDDTEQFNVSCLVCQYRAVLWPHATPAPLDVRVAALTAERDEAQMEYADACMFMDEQREKIAALQAIPSVTMLPRPRTAYFEWGDPPLRETYTVLGIAMTGPEAPDAARLYHATWLLVERSDHRLTWLSMNQLTLDEPATPAATPAPLPQADLDRACEGQSADFVNGFNAGLTLAATPAPLGSHPGKRHDYEMTCRRCGEPGYLFVGLHGPGETFKWSGYEESGV